MSEPLPFPAPRFTMEPEEVSEKDVTPGLVEMAMAVAKICSTRILLLLAVLISAPIWTYTVYEPTTYRIAAATAYAVVSVLPLVFLYVKRG
jgi:hypothetical protein